MTYNVNYGNPAPRASLDAIAVEDADVVLIQELTASWQAALADRFSSQYPVLVFHLHGRKAGGLAVLSKLPVGGDELFSPPEGGWFPAQRLVVTTEAGDVQILHVHLRPALDHGSWIAGFMSTPPVREHEIKTYVAQLANLPTLVAGDFNEDPHSGMALAYLERSGYRRVETTGPRTWHYEDNGWDLLKMDLDHIVVGAGLIASAGRVLDAGTSDHRPVVATIEVSSAHG
jgi:vancomycin resistance protein VanJ